MNLIFQSIILGIIQGLTEFFPISSSAHLVIFQHFFNIKKEAPLLDAILHAGTLMATIFVFWNEIIKMIKDVPFIIRRKGTEKEGVRLIYLILIGTVPSVIIGLLFQEGIESSFSSPKQAGVFLLFTSLMIFLTKFTRVKNRIRGYHALIIGIFQSLALLPGISRSGATIASALALGWEREFAFKFSFLLSIPAIAGANILELSNAQISNLNSTALITGFFISFISGFIALKILSPLVRRGKFYLFSIYCLIAGLGIILFL